jgi:hypothetical protein
MLVVLFGFLVVVPSNRTAAQTTTLATDFTYQGYLEQAGVPINGNCDIQFSLFNALTAGTQVGSTQAKTNVPVSTGRFSVQLDFGTVFNGQDRFLALTVRCPAGSGAYTPLTPRQPIMPSPYAMYAVQALWSGLTGVPAGFADGTDADSGGDITGVTAGTGLSGGGASGAITLSADAAYLQRRVGANCAAGSSIRVINADGTVTCEADDTGGAYWSLTGNAGTNPANNFIGTTDNQPFELVAGFQRVLRFESNSTSPNLIGGLYGNYLGFAVTGATIAGGGCCFGNVVFPNVVFDNFGTISGGYNNSVGVNDFNLDNQQYATVGGGFGNLASGLASVVIGGNQNTASGQLAVVLGGDSNQATGQFSTVVGGIGNLAQGVGSQAGGLCARALHDGSFVWGDSQNCTLIGPYAVSTAPNQFLIRANGGFRFVTQSNPTTGLPIEFYNLGSGVLGWQYSSDRNLKENITPIDAETILDALLQIPISLWNFRGNDASIRNLGPMAQDWHAAFAPLGLATAGETMISSGEAQNVALASIQALYAEIQAKDARIAELEAENIAQEAQLEAFEARLSALEDVASAGTASPAWLIGGLGLVGTLAGWFVHKRNQGS